MKRTLSTIPHQTVKDAREVFGKTLEIDNNVYVALSGHFLECLYGVRSELANTRARLGFGTRSGVAAARRRGRHPGRPRVLDDRTRARVQRLRAAGNSIRAVASKMGLSKSVVARQLIDPSKN